MLSQLCLVSLSECSVEELRYIAKDFLSSCLGLWARAQLCGWAATAARPIATALLLLMT